MGIRHWRGAMRRLLALSKRFVLAALPLSLAFFFTAQNRATASARDQMLVSRVNEAMANNQNPRSTSRAGNRRNQQRHQQARRPNWQRDRMQMLQTLGLSQDQRRDARRLFKRRGPQLQQLRDELEEQKDALSEAILGEPYDQKLVEQRIQVVLEKEEGVLRTQAEIELALFEIFTPEQRAKFRELHTNQLEIRQLEREIRMKRRQMLEKLQPEPR